MTEEARSLITLLALILGAGAVTALVIIGLGIYLLKGDDDERM